MDHAPADSDQDRAFSPLQAAACPYRITFAPSDGQKVLKVQGAMPRDTAFKLMGPLECMQRLASRVPRPRVHLIRFHGVLPPNAKLRALMVPRGPEQATGKSELPATGSGFAHSLPGIAWARLLKRVLART